MQQIFHMAIKDLRLITRDRMGMFFILFFPILLGVFFGLVMGPGVGSSSGKMKVALVDQDQSDISKKFAASLASNRSIELQESDLESARESVRKAQRVAYVLLPPGFRDRAGVFWGEPAEVQLGLDPSRNAETAMLQGFIMQAMGSLIGERFRDPQQFQPYIDQARKELEASDANSIEKGLISGFFNSIDAMIASATLLNSATAANGEGNAAGPQEMLQFANITTHDITREIDPNSIAGQMRKFRSRWDISFPQAMLWGVLGCIVGFSISIAREETLGTMLRLQVAPVGAGKILAGKAFACFLAALLVLGLLVVLGVLLGMRPASYPKLAAAAVVISLAFTGIMMVISLLGRTENGVSGAATAVNMIMAMLGGCMIPVMFMPDFLRQLSVVSPVYWAIRSIEGAVWREFSWNEMAWPLGVLLATGAVCMVLGTVMLRRRLG